MELAAVGFIYVFPGYETDLTLGSRDRLLDHLPVESDPVLYEARDGSLVRVSRAAGRKTRHLYVTRLENGLLALSPRSTHTGCIVEWQESERVFLDPCHFSRFDRNGAVLSGPAPRPLDLLALRLDEEGNLIVDTDTVIERQEHSPDQAFAM